MITKVFILGNHIQALGIARQVYSLGMEVYLFTASKYSIARYSNTVKKTIIFSDVADLYEKIINAREKEKNVLLFPTSDSMVDFLSINFGLLIKDFYIGIPAPEIVNIFYNKRNTYQFALAHGIPVPETYYPNTLEYIESLSKRIKFLVILKPAIMHTFHDMFGVKAFKCSTSTELSHKAEFIAKSFPVEQLMVQEFLSGGAKTLFSYGAFSANGNVIAGIMANRIRQNPMEFGNSTTFALTCNIQKIQEYAEKILKLTNYFGLAEVEFMYDEKTDQYKFLEINTRAWKWHSISNGLGYSFIGKMINWINKNDEAIIKDFNTNVAWVERLTDFSVIAKEIFRSNMSFAEAIKSYRIRKVHAVWAINDLKPFIMYLLLSPLLYFKRH
ncbi:hypothetical protein DSECCO2_382820 [anaerobic digester metagenome]